MRPSFGKQATNSLLALAVVLAAWKLLSLLYPPLVIPPLSSVAGKIAEILTNGKLLGAIGTTALRLLAGLCLGVAAGSALGMLLGRFSRLHDVFRPLLGLMQSIPPISWLVLAMIWFGFNGRAVVFIVAVGALPTMTITLVEGLANIDVKLLQMARVYRFSRSRRLRYIVAPSVAPYFRSGLRIAVGVGCKTAVMGEVLTTASGIGGAITDARLNIEPESVAAWTVMIVLLYHLLDALVSLLLPGGKRHAENTRSEKELREPAGAGQPEP